VEWWRAVGPYGVLVAEGAVRPGIDGRPVGRWRLFDADGAERATVKFKKLDVCRREDLAQLAAAVPTWTRLAAGGPGTSRKMRQCAVHLLAAAPGEDAGTALRACLTKEMEGERDRRVLADLLLCLALHPGAATDAIGALSLLPPEQSRECLAQMCAALDAAGPLGSIEIARALLDIVFPTGAYSDGAPLTEDQRTVVRAIADAETAWTFDVNLREVLRYNGLPTDSDKLRAL
jgi:hypothetical protein